MQELISILIMFPQGNGYDIQKWPINSMLIFTLKFLLYLRQFLLTLNQSKCAKHILLYSYILKMFSAMMVDFT